MNILKSMEGKDFLQNYADAAEMAALIHLYLWCLNFGWERWSDMFFHGAGAIVWYWISVKVREADEAPREN